MISALTIDNFKCFATPTRFDFSLLNIFTGYNGRGKSSVFQTLLLLAQSFKKNGNIENLEVNGDFIRLDLFEDLINRDSSEPIRFILESLEPEYASVELGYTELSDRVGKIVELKINGKSFFQQAASLSNEQNTEKVSHLYTYPKDFHNLLTEYNYIAADRLGPTRYEEKEEISKSNPIGCNGEHRLNALVKDKELLKKASEWINYIMDGGVIEVTGKENKQSAVLNLLFQTNCKTHKKGFKSINCGFGYSYILSIVIMVLMIDRGRLFIENPEAHLHPKAQSRLMELICRKASEKNIQIFIETHSEHIINSVRLCSLKKESPITYQDVSIYFFDKDYKVIKLTMDEQAQISNWPNGFFDQQEIDLSEILKLGLLK